MAILVTGGAGYIGSHIVDLLIRKGYETVVVDHLAAGHRQAVHPKAAFYEGDIRSQDFLNSVLSGERIEAVFHFAASSLVGESMKNPLHYYDNNVLGSLNLLKALDTHKVKQLVFSSTAAVYGEAKSQPIQEDAPLKPASPYGETKLAIERMLHWWAQASGARFVSLRYFNAAGAKASGGIGEDHQNETHLIPIILQAALGKRESVSIFGDDYPTKDGTCIRDYIHVEDLAEAHLLALRYLEAGGESNVFNLGGSKGISVKEVIETAAEVTNRCFKVTIAPRRSGDPAELVASSEKARSLLNWQPKKTSIRQIVEDAWSWHRSHPDGYPKS
ncbi:UDP-glucose 4-epimerase GalE [Cytobacillus sp. FSL W8-0315]|uniref:UDP-glucose 4-epimerase GalE n=1 Tax=Cytobacillus TaxID=2675230 RepID=UPI002040FADA|nr:UDP-glucose 4-epimerase GalE [Cytobacillus oceanisediminis]MCM3242028.1 UDP-glucose 4-epimerase GalE [Cytobacillus oceanisediminis]MCS0825919.1 UDP-glucose 4-epimerase GalE [Cytobacillus firmus]